MMIHTLVKIYLSWRYLFIALFLVCLATFVHFLPQLTYRIELHSLLKSDSDQTLSEIKEFYKTFPPSEGAAIITVSFEKVVTMADLRQTRKWVEELKALPETKRVISSFDMILEMKHGDFTLDEWIELADAENEPVTLGTGQGIEMIHGNFISKDMRSLAFYVEKKGGMRQHVKALQKVTSTWGYETRVLGMNVMLAQGGNMLKDELLQLIFLLVLVLVVLLPLILKSFRMSYLPLSIAIMSVSMFLSLLAYADEPITLMTLAAPILIIVISLSNTIHLQRYFDNERSGGANVAESLTVMLRNGGVACFMTTLTTAIGFISLLVVQHEEIRDFGFWCGVGVMMTFLNIMLFFPLFLFYLPGREKTNKVYHLKNTERLARFSKPVGVLLLLVSVGSMFAFFDTSIYNELPQDSQGVQDMKWFNQHFRGTERVEIEVKGPLTNFEVFQSVEKLQDELRQIPGVSGVSSYATLLRYMGPSGVLDYEDGIGPASKALNSLPEYPINIINKGMNHACIIFYTSSEFGSAQYRNFKAKFEELLPNLPKEAEFKMNGYVNMAYNSINYITDSLFYSLGVSILAITLVMMIYLRSIVFALLCLVPNVLPIAVTLGLAGWFNIPVGVGIIVILIIGLGLAVDDTVHLVIKFIDNKKKGEQVSVKESLDQAVSTTGYAIVITSVVILVAAATFMQSSFSTLNETGMVLGVVTVSAILADLFVFPWVLEKYYAVLQNLKLS